MDETLWHKCTPFLPKRLITGEWSLPTGQMWRREINGRWQYRQDEETAEDWINRQI